MSDALKDYNMFTLIFLQTIMDISKPERESCFLIKSRFEDQ